MLKASMTELIVADSTKNRRNEKVWQRRWKRLKFCWQILVLGGMTGGVIWMMSWPEWSIRSQQQVNFWGNESVSAETLHQQTGLQYPQSIWLLSTEALDAQLEASPVLANVEVSRKIFPAQLQIFVTERQPVAIAVREKTLGYLDETGVFIPASLYREDARKKFPQTPQFLGFSHQYQNFWQAYGERIRQSPLEIRLINANNPSRLTMTTNLGQVLLGSNFEQFDRQLVVLEKMQNLPRSVPKDRLIYLDVSDPNNPRIQVTPQS